MNVLETIVVLISLISLVVYAKFTFTEAKDERGQRILGKVHIATIFVVLLGFCIISLSPLVDITVDQLRQFVYIWFSIVMLVMAISILYFKKAIY